MIFLLSYIILFSIVALAVECITELVTKDSVFLAPKIFIIRVLSKISNPLAEFFAELVSCGRCLSGWLSMPPVFFILTAKAIFFLPSKLDLGGIFVLIYLCILYMVTWLFTWRVANIWHLLIDKLKAEKKE